MRRFTRSLLTAGLVLTTALALAGPARATLPRPSAPRQLAATAGVLSATLTWLAPSTGKPFDRYRVARASAATGPWTTLTSSLTTRRYVAKGLAAKPYFFRVGAHNRSGWGAWTKGVRTVPRAATPSAPTNLDSSRVLVPPTGPGEPTWDVTVTWTPPSSVGAAPIDAYRVETSLAATGPWTLVTSTTQLSYHVVLPYQDDLRRYYRVTAHNSHGFGAPAVTSIPGAAGPVSGIHVVPGSTTLALTWNAPADDGGAGITGYSVQWQQIDAMGNPVGSQGFANTSATHYTVTGLTNGVIYQLTIAANNGVTGGAAEPFGAVPGVPYGTHITHATPTRTSASTVDVAVAWTAPTGDGGSPLTGYQVQIWDENPASTSPLAAFTASSSATGHTFSGLGLTAGVHYVAVVQPFNANNSGASAPGYADVAEFLTP